MTEDKTNNFEKYLKLLQDDLDSTSSKNVTLKIKYDDSGKNPLYIMNNSGFSSGDATRLKLNLIDAGVPEGAIEIEAGHGGHGSFLRAHSYQSRCASSHQLPPASTSFDAAMKEKLADHKSTKRLNRTISAIEEIFDIKLRAIEASEDEELYLTSDTDVEGFPKLRTTLKDFGLEQEEKDGFKINVNNEGFAGFAKFVQKEALSKLKSRINECVDPELQKSASIRQL